MKKTLIFAIAMALVLGFSATSANAAAFTIGDAYYLGSIDPGSPASEADEAGYINHLIGMTAPSGPTVFEGHSYVRSALGGAFPDAVEAGSSRDFEAPFGPVNVEGWTYLLGKYGNVDYVWYVAGQTGEWGLPANDAVPGAGGGQGMSHYTLFNPTSVPDGGMTLILLGGALVGLEALRRKFRA